MKPTYEFFEEIDSTNNELKRRLEKTALPEGFVVSAGTQTAGRGRSGHDWISPKNVSVSTSMVVYPKGIESEYVSRLTLIAAAAVAEAIEDLYPLQTQIKWPNDILLNKKKVCGILTEMQAKDNRPEYVIVGIGVNVHDDSFAPEIGDMATSIDLELRERSIGIETHRGELTKRIWECFARYYDAFCQKGDLSPILDFYEKRLINKGQKVRVLDPAGEYEGIALSMDETGRLLIQTDDIIRRVDSGEVSVHGLYGYV